MKLSKTQLGWLDTALLLPYAVIQILLGSVGDKIGPRKTFGISLILSGLSMISFGFWNNFYMFSILLFLNGAAQAQCWPNCVKILGEWFPDRVRNSVFGSFGTCAFGGGIMGTALAVFLQMKYGWREVYLLPSTLVIILGFTVLLQFKQPKELKIEVPGKESDIHPSGATEKLNYLQLMKIPMMLEVAMAVFCLKIVRYSMYMWLPMFLSNELKYSKNMAGLFSTTFEIGGVVGSFGIGFVMDRYFSQVPLIGTTLSAFLSGITLVLFNLTSHWGILFNNLFMLLAGAFNCGPDSILGAAIPSKIGAQDGRNAAAAAVGFVNGFGSLGTIIEGPIIGFVSTMYGWSGMFYLMIFLSLLGSFMVLKAAYIQKSQEKNAIFQEV